MTTQLARPVLRSDALELNQILAIDVEDRRVTLATSCYMEKWTFKLNCPGALTKLPDGRYYGLGLANYSRPAKTIQLDSTPHSTGLSKEADHAAHFLDTNRAPHAWKNGAQHGCCVCNKTEPVGEATADTT